MHNLTTLLIFLMMLGVTAGFGLAAPPENRGKARRALAQHQRIEKQRLHRHQRQQRRIARERDLDGQRLRRHQHRERRQLQRHQRRERERIKDVLKP